MASAILSYLEKGQFQQEEPSRLEFVKDEFERQSLSNAGLCPPPRLFLTSAAHIAYNAIIYFELSNARRTNYKFSFDAMLNMKGNTAMYLIYAYARIRYFHAGCLVIIIVDQFCQEPKKTTSNYQL